MNEYFDKARELGEMIKQSEKSMAVEKARAAFQADPAAAVKMDEYNAYQDNVRFAMENNAMDQEQFKVATKRLTEMATELKAYQPIGDLVHAENEFNFFVNQIMDVLKVTVTGEELTEGGCNSCASKGNCSSDSCGHAH